MTKPKTNPWDNTDALLMAIRLRRKGIIYPEVEELLGLVLIEIVKLATALMLKTKDYRGYRELFLDNDTQAMLQLHVLMKLDKVDTSEKPKTVVNFIITVVTNRLRELIRSRNCLKNRGKLCLESETEDFHEILPVHSDFFGQTRNSLPTGKTVTKNKLKL